MIWQIYWIYPSFLREQFWDFFQKTCFNQNMKDDKDNDSQENDSLSFSAIELHLWNIPSQ